ncbi:helix-turn-helix transcriptional regulator [Kineobactrum salinum]|uniref:Helix-turn-helix transcriptional regulator n=1 Tax=Kineobactrum salinum TaxID=2708301 RepID=A0A6C0U065_9GAMM|nr:helix-turn-helix transcriptional regulator [Kineobactrum salinum]QIB64979.1 helix-turn-helix transcriptional regulator [Kineobactrum salinum]
MEISNTFCSEMTELTAHLRSDEFKSRFLRVMDRLIGVSHYVMFVFDKNHIEDLTASIVEEGGASKKLISRQAAIFMDKIRHRMWINPELLQHHDHKSANLETVYRYNPALDDDEERKKLFRSSNTREKVYMVDTRDNWFYLTSFYRGAQHAEMSDDKYQQLKPLFPLFNNLLILRHELRGIEEERHKIQLSLASMLKERGVEPFSRLSNRETEVCDRLLRGITSDGVAADLNLARSTVNTLRKRAYTKIGITSKSQLFALVINSHL